MLEQRVANGFHVSGYNLLRQARPVRANVRDIITADNRNSEYERTVTGDLESPSIIAYVPGRESLSDWYQRLIHNVVVNMLASKGHLVLRYSMGKGLFYLSKHPLTNKPEQQNDLQDRFIAADIAAMSQQIAQDIEYYRNIARPGGQEPKVGFIAISAGTAAVPLAAKKLQSSIPHGITADLIVPISSVGDQSILEAYTHMDNINTAHIDATYQDEFTQPSEPNAIIQAVGQHANGTYTIHPERRKPLNHIITALGAVANGDYLHSMFSA